MAFKHFCDGLSKEEANKVCLLMHTQPIDDNGTDLPEVAHQLCGGYNVAFSSNKLDTKFLNYMYNMASVTINIASNEGFGLGSLESLTAGTPIVVNVTGGMQDQCGFKNDKGEYFVQCAGGCFTNERPDHFGSGLILENGSTFKNELEVDRGQYDKVREVAWTTFGGCYIRRSFIDKVGDFDPAYEWTYNRDVDYCLRGRESGERIYQIPVRLFHHESRDTRRIKDESKAQMETRNLARLQTKWANTNFYKTLDREIKNG